MAFIDALALLQLHNKDFKISKDIENKGKEEQFSAVILRYFNPVGAHPSGLMGMNKFFQIHFNNVGGVLCRRRSEWYSK